MFSILRAIRPEGIRLVTRLDSRLKVAGCFNFRATLVPTEQFAFVAQNTLLPKSLLHIQSGFSVLIV